MIHKSYRNAASDDLAIIDKQISDLLAQIADYTVKRANAAVQLKKCNGKIFNWCQNNTGKTAKTWSNYINSWNIAIANWELQVKKLRAEREIALVSMNTAMTTLQKQTVIQQQQKEVQKVEAEIQSVNATKYVKYILIGAGVIALAVGGFMLYKKFKK
jgi:hypothetical protein